MKAVMRLSVFGSVLVAVLCGCKTGPKYADFGPARFQAQPAVMETVTNRLDPAWLQPSTNAFTLGPGDRLEIELMDEVGSRTPTVVGPDGKIYFYLLPGLDVWGLTLDQTRQLIEQQLSKYVRGAARVNITLRAVQSKRVWLLGRFQAPGVYTMATPMTLLEAITMAGGPQTFVGIQEIDAGALGEDLADLRRSFVVRNGRLLPVDLHDLLKEGDLSQNIYLEPDDFVYFSPAYTKQVYVIGAVTQSKAVAYTEGMGVAAAIAGAYGTVRDAYLHKVAVVRGSLSQPKATVVDYYDIVKGRAPDVALEPQDIVFVPYSPYRYVRKYAEMAVNTFVSSVAINAGVRAVAPPNAVGAGVFIPVGSGIQIVPPSAPPIQ